MPWLVPVVATIGGWVAGSAVTIGMTGITSIVVGAAVGAVVGAAIGAVGAALTGGDIGEGALYGAIGGAIGGGIGGYMSGIDTAAGVSLSESTAYGSAKALGTEAAVTASAPSSTSGGLINFFGESGGIGSTTQTVAGGATMLGGQMISGEQNKKAAELLAEQTKLRDEESFAARLNEIAATSESQLAQIGAQGENADSQLAASHANNLESLSLQNEQMQEQIKLRHLGDLELQDEQYLLTQQQKEDLWAKEQADQDEYNQSVVGALQGNTSQTGSLVFNKETQSDPRFMQEGLLG